MDSFEDLNDARVFKIVLKYVTFCKDTRIIRKLNRKTQEFCAKKLFYLSLRC